MAKVTIMGDACVLKSAVKLEDYAKIQKYRPQDMFLYGGEDGKEPIFGVCVVKNGPGNINANGVEFSRHTNDEDQFACLTMVLGGDEDYKKMIADDFGAALLKLNEFEAKVPELLEAIEAEKAQIDQLITVAE